VEDVVPRSSTGDPRSTTARARPPRRNPCGFTPLAADFRQGQHSKAIRCQPNPRLSGLVSLVVCIAIMGGCQPRKQTIQSAPPPVLSHIEPATYRADVLALVTPPVGWVPEPIKASAKHTHQIWLSPSGNTAYGVIFFNLPWPVGHDLGLLGFINEMRRTEGKATVQEKKNDPNLPGLRFVAEGGLYTVRGNMFVQGRRGWVVYAGTKVQFPIDEKELEIAVQARESTRIGVRVMPGSTTLPTTGPGKPTTMRATTRSTTVPTTSTTRPPTTSPTTRPSTAVATPVTTFPDRPSTMRAVE
jgi:hypothetical protein